MQILFISGAFHQIRWEAFSGFVVLDKNSGSGAVVEGAEQDIHQNRASGHSIIRDFLLEGDTLTFSKFYMDTVCVRVGTGDDMLRHEPRDMIPNRREWISYRLVQQDPGLFVGTWSRLADSLVDRQGKVRVRLSEVALGIALDEIIGLDNDETVEQEIESQ